MRHATETSQAVAYISICENVRSRGDLSLSIPGNNDNLGRVYKDETVAGQNATSAVIHEKTDLSALHVPTACPTSGRCSVRTGSCNPGVGVGWRHHPPGSSNAE